jgi:hypothetical protein
MATSRPEQLGSALRATVAAIQEIVATLHTGVLASDLTALPAKNVYWTPSFQQGRAPESALSVPYSALLLSLLLGNATADRHAHPIVKLSLLICELKELGALTDKDEQDIFDGTDSFTQGLLQEVLLRTREAHYEVEATTLLEQTA